MFLSYACFSCTILSQPQKHSNLLPFRSAVVLPADDLAECFQQVRYIKTGYIKYQHID